MLGTALQSVQSALHKIAPLNQTVLDESLQVDVIPHLSPYTINQTFQEGYNQLGPFLIATLCQSHLSPQNQFLDHRMLPLLLLQTSQHQVNLLLRDTPLLLYPSVLGRQHILMSRGHAIPLELDNLHP